jgi:hypothetical protein
MEMKKTKMKKGGMLCPVHKYLCPKCIKVYTDIDPTVDFVFPVNKIDRENNEKLVSQEKFEVNQMRIQKL